MISCRQQGQNSGGTVHECAEIFSEVCLIATGAHIGFCCWFFRELGSTGICSEVWSDWPGGFPPVPHPKPQGLEDSSELLSPNLHLWPLYMVLMLIHCIYEKMKLVNEVMWFFLFISQLPVGCV